MSLTQHFIDRVAERMPGEDPEFLWNGIAWAIENDRTDLVEFVGRQDRAGQRLFRFRSARTGEPMIIACNTDLGVPITVFPDDGRHRNTGRPGRRGRAQ